MNWIGPEYIRIYLYVFQYQYVGILKVLKDCSFVLHFYQRVDVMYMTSVGLPGLKRKKMTTKKMRVRSFIGERIEIATSDADIDKQYVLSFFLGSE